MWSGFLLPPLIVNVGIGVDGETKFIDEAMPPITLNAMTSNGDKSLLILNPIPKAIPTPIKLVSVDAISKPIWNPFPILKSCFRIVPTIKVENNPKAIPLDDFEIKYSKYVGERFLLSQKDVGKIGTLKLKPIYMILFLLKDL